jgi:hypothetical protein
LFEIGDKALDSGKPAINGLGKVISTKPKKDYVTRSVPGFDIMSRRFDIGVSE